ncbi:Universal stress protein family [Labilithrix luteola]|uniref:Universal stress protein n=1 Tax=Labilithrix luteola TaxID=1391654 RepID=A0A0K1Q4E7_9BACT|nr:universal stress protein [Labilithrix luteola]AKV00532.1 Universal stress protein family [Labilithrix luteola]
MQFNHILVPIDFGEPSLRALDAAISLAPKFGSTITLLHVSWLPPPVYAAYAQGFAWPTEEMERSAREELASVLEKTRAEYDAVEGLVVTGEPRQMILDVAAERCVDLIVMGTHGRHGIPRAILGSVAERIVRQSVVPVLTVSAKPGHSGHA